MKKTDIYKQKPGAVVKKAKGNLSLADISRMAKKHGYILKKK